MDSWKFTVEGQPPSVNHTYRVVRIKRGTQTITTLAKLPGVLTYQDAVTWRVKQARPHGWMPGKRVRLVYSYFLKRDIDTDNMKKATNDAIALGLGCDDKVFLSCDRFKVLKDPHPRVEIEVWNEDEDGDRGSQEHLAHP